MVMAFEDTGRDIISDTGKVVAMDCENAGDQ